VPKLDDHLLSDIGMTRSNIVALSRGKTPSS
jgi:uncharacterized protein YjiS (DUF1127 family)